VSECETTRTIAHTNPLYASAVGRDLKPHNLLLSEESPKAIVKIADFGFARIMAPQGLAETVCGSPLYMAPEVLSSSKYDIKADLWSVGTILYQMVCGSTPYHGDNYIHLLENIKKKRWVMPPEIQSKCSPACLGLLQRLLQKDPRQRCDHAEFMAHPFLGFQSKSPGAAQRAATGVASAPTAGSTGTPVEGAAQGKPSKISPGLPPRLPAPGIGGAPTMEGGGILQTAPGGLPRGHPGGRLTLERELSCGSDDEFVLIGTPPATPPLRVAWRGAEMDGDGVKLVRQSSLPEGFGGVMGTHLDQKVTAILARSEEGFEAEDSVAYRTSQATVVMELANAMLQHSPRDALALYVKALQLFQQVITQASGMDGEVLAFSSHGSNSGSSEGTAEEAKRLFLTVFEKSEKLAASLPPNGTGLLAEEILYECALAMGREAASCEILNDTATARKHYGCAFVCLQLLKSQAKNEADTAILTGFLKQIEIRSKDLFKAAKDLAGSLAGSGMRSSDDESSPSPIHQQADFGIFQTSPMTLDPVRPGL